MITPCASNPVSMARIRSTDRIRSDAPETSMTAKRHLGDDQAGVNTARPAPKSFFAAFANVKPPTEDLAHGNDRDAQANRQRERKRDRKRLPSQRYRTPETLLNRKAGDERAETDGRNHRARDCRHRGQRDRFGHDLSGDARVTRP